MCGLYNSNLLTSGTIRWQKDKYEQQQQKLDLFQLILPILSLQNTKKTEEKILVFNGIKLVRKNKIFEQMFAYLLICLAFKKLIVNKSTQNDSPANKTSVIKSCWLPKQFLEQLMRCYVLMEKTSINA